MTVDGLYGHVIRVGKKSSRVLKLEDLNSRIAVMSKRSQSRAILIGDNSRVPVLSYVIDAADWVDGDVVITSGDDGVLPLGLPVGAVRVADDGSYLVDLSKKRDKESNILYELTAEMINEEWIP